MPAPRGRRRASPYSADGLTLWAHSSGYMSVNESAFYAVLPADEGREPYLNFYAAERGGVPVTLTGAAPFAATRRGAAACSRRRRYTILRARMERTTVCVPS